MWVWELHVQLEWWQVEQKRGIWIHMEACKPLNTERKSSSVTFLELQGKIDSKMFPNAKRYPLIIQVWGAITEGGTTGTILCKIQKQELYGLARYVYISLDHIWYDLLLLAHTHPSPTYHDSHTKHTHTHTHLRPSAANGAFCPVVGQQILIQMKYKTSLTALTTTACFW